MSRFSLELSQNKYLSPADTSLHVVLTVSAEATSATTGPPGAEVLLVDCSSSMDWPPSKISRARRAAAAAIDALPGGTRFAVVEGTHRARMCFPDGETLVPANQDTRMHAKAAVHRLIAGGGTAMSRWLGLANRLFEAEPDAQPEVQPDAVRHALLLTDGRNESEPPTHLWDMLVACEGRFTCDARGIGDDWEPEQLRRIASVLRGSADAVLEETDLAADFRRLIGLSSRRTVRDLRLRVTTASFATVRFLHQVLPTEAELAGKAGHEVEASTGAWGDETREYHLCLEVDLRDLTGSADLPVGVVELVPVTSDVEVPAPQQILGHVTDDVTLSTPMDPKVERYTVQREIGEHQRAGWARFTDGDLAGAQEEWGHAVRLATELGNAEVVRRLERIVHIDDAAQGRVRLRDGIRPGEVFSMLLSFTGFPPSEEDTERTDRIRPEAGEPRRCARCETVSPPRAKFCGKCGERFAERPR